MLLASRRKQMQSLTPTTRYSLVLICLSLLIAVSGVAAVGQTTNNTALTAVKSVEITSEKTEFEVGQQVKFSAVAKDESGKALAEKPAGWYAAPFDLAAADESGTISFYQPGEVTIISLVGGKPGF